MVSVLKDHHAPDHQPVDIQSDPLEGSPQDELYYLPTTCQKDYVELK